MLVTFITSLIIKCLPHRLGKVAMVDCDINDAINDQMDEESDLSDNEYEVEKIVNMRKLKGVQYYKMKWLNYSSSFDQWLPESKLNCSERINEFMASKKLTKKKMAKPDITPIIGRGIKKFHRNKRVRFAKRMEQIRFFYINTKISRKGKVEN